MTQDERTIRREVRGMADRRLYAYDLFIQTLQSFGGITADEASTVAAAYLRHKAIKFDSANTRYTVKHGALLDREQIRYVLSLAD